MTTHCQDIITTPTLASAVLIKLVKKIVGHKTKAMPPFLLCFLSLLLLSHLTMGFLVVRPVRAVSRPGSSCLLFASFNVKVIDQSGATHNVMMDESKTILANLQKTDIDPPYSCQTGVCGECSALVETGIEGIVHEACIMDEDTVEKGLILTCATRFTSEGSIRLGMSEELYESQYGEFRKDHEDQQAKSRNALDSVKSAFNINVEA